MAAGHHFRVSDRVPSLLKTILCHPSHSRKAKTFTTAHKALVICPQLHLSGVISYPALFCPLSAPTTLRPWPCLEQTKHFLHFHMLFLLAGMLFHADSHIVIPLLFPCFCLKVMLSGRPYLTILYKIAPPSPYLSHYYFSCLD